jgi:hypothetical protein
LFTPDFSAVKSLIKGEYMEDKELKKELDKIPDVDENGDSIYKIDGDSEETADRLQDVPVGELSNTSDESEFKDTPQDLKDGTSQE